MPRPDQQIWFDVLSYLRTQHPDICRQWFDEIEPAGLSGGVMALRVVQPIQRRYLQRECNQRFTEAAQAVTGRLLTIRFIAPEEPSVVVTDSAAGAVAAMGSNGTGAQGAAATPPAPAWGRPSVNLPPDPPAHALREPGVGEIGPGPVTDGDNEPDAARQSVPGAPGGSPGASQPAAASAPVRESGLMSDDSLVISPDYTFDQFIVGPENRLAHAAALAVAENPGRAYNPLFVHGGVGLGKTHLLQAIALALIGNRPGTVIHYVSCEAFITQYVESVKANQMADFRHRFRDADVLIIDDIHFLAKRDRSQEEFFHTFNALHQHKKQIILSSDAAPQDIPDLELRLVSRFQSGLVVPISPPCYDTRVEIVKRKAALRGLAFPEDAACYIAAKIATNIRELEGAITRVQMQAIADKRTIDVGLARLALGDHANSPRPEVTISAIIDAVIDHYNVKLTDLQSKRRQKSIAHPRQVCMFLARKHTRYSLEEIGGYFGGRDHTTVMHAVRTVEARLGWDEEFRKVLASLDQRLAPGEAR